ncbi:hypothetical protein ACO0LN_30310, partial [Undibacterium sp. TC9W]
LTLGNFSYTGTFSAGAGTDTLVLGTASNIGGANVTGFENLTIATGGSVTMSAAQFAAATGTIVAAGTVAGTNGETVTLSTAGTITGSAVIENFVLANGTNAVTLATTAANQTFTGGTGNDAFTTTYANLAWKTINAGLGTDTVTVTDAVTA